MELGGSCAINWETKVEIYPPGRSLIFYFNDIGNANIRRQYLEINIIIGVRGAIN